MTRYRIALPCGTLELRVGERQPQLDACLRQAGFSCWCLLTAWNPGSRLLPREENRARQEKLKKYLLDRGHIIFRVRIIPVQVAGPWNARFSSLVHPGRKGVKRRFCLNKMPFWPEKMICLRNCCGFSRNSVIPSGW